MRHDESIPHGQSVFFNTKVMSESHKGTGRISPTSGFQEKTRTFTKQVREDESYHAQWHNFRMDFPPITIGKKS